MIRLTLLAIVYLSCSAIVRADDWPIGGRTRSRNPVSHEIGAPIDWQVADEDVAARNILWSVELGSGSPGGPVVANGLIWVGTNNYQWSDRTIDDDRGVLLCIRESDGKILDRHSWERLGDRRFDWPHQGISGSPVVEGNRVWFLNNRREVICLNTAPLHMEAGPAPVVWTYDLVTERGVVPGSPMLPTANTLGSLATFGDLLFVPTGNRAELWNRHRFAAPGAPSLVCLRKETGELVWEDHSAGDEGWEEHHSSPLVIEIDGEAQVVHAQADGWVRSFEARTGEPLWQFDVNPKNLDWSWKPGKKSKAVVEGNPTFADGRIYFATSRGKENTTKDGRLLCIDATKTGDISAERIDDDGRVVANPASGLIWDYSTEGDDESLWIHHSVSCVAVHDGLAIAADMGGNVHCFDAATGDRHWSHDMLAGVLVDPLIVDGKIYIADEDSDVDILKLSPIYEQMATHAMIQSIEAPPVFANGVLYVQTRSTLYAIGSKKPHPDRRPAAR